MHGSTMSTLTHKVLLLLALTSCGGTSIAQRHTAQPVQNAPCVAIENVDFQNASFESGGHVFSFHHGKAFSRDCENCEQQEPRPDWEATIEKDILVSPSPGMEVRFLLVHDVHQTGTGWWYYLMGFRCAPSAEASGAKPLLKVFDRKAMFLRVEELTDRNVKVSVVVGKGVKRHYMYAWDSGTRTYALRNLR